MNELDGYKLRILAWVDIHKHLQKEVHKLNKALRRRRIQRKRLEEKFRKIIKQKDEEIRELGNSCISFQNL